MRLEALSDAGGIAVEALDLTAPRSEEEDRALMQLFDLYGLVVFRSQNLTPDQLVAAGRPFGGTMMKKEAVTYDSEMPGVVVISTRGPNGDIMPANDETLIGDLEWHTDQGYLTKPNRGKILYAVEVPKAGGMTGYIDGQRTCEALPPLLRRRLEGLHVVQSWARSESYLARNRDYRIEGHQELKTERYPDVVYPFIYPHPVTGKAILNAPPLWSSGIVELPGTAGDDLLAEVLEHIVQPRFQYWHRYRIGDAVLWDNWRFMHAASGTPAPEIRTLWAITLNSGPQIARFSTATA